MNILEGFLLMMIVLAFALYGFPWLNRFLREDIKGIRIGLSSESGRPLHYPTGSGHIMTIAPTRMGKGRDIIIPALLEWAGSCVIVDPKGELAAVTAKYRRKFGKVLVLNPFKIWLRFLSGLTAVSFNPLGTLDPNSPSFGADVDKLAEAIVWLEEGQTNHWIESARQLISGVIMALVKHGAASEKNLLTVREVISGGSVYAFCREAIKSPDPFIRHNLARFAVALAENNDELNSIVSTATTQLRFIGNQAIADNISKSDFRFRDLKREVITVYLVLPLGYLDVCAKWFRLVISSALADLISEEKGLPVLCLLDEFFQLGSLKAIENAMGMAAGFNITLWPILQDLVQLQGLFPRTWETFLSNAVQMFFGPRDKTTSEYLSSLCGHTERRVASKSLGPRQSMNISQIGRPLLDPYDARQLKADEMIILAPNVSGVIRARRRPYWMDFRGYGKNPYFG